MARVTTSEAVRYGFSLIAFGITIALSVAVIIVVGINAGDALAGLSVLVAITIVYAAVIGSVYKVIADGVQRGMEGVRADEEVLSSGSQGVRDEQADKMNYAVQEALAWYETVSDRSQAVNDIKRRFETVDTVSELTTDELGLIIKAIDEYTDNIGQSDSMNKARQAIVRQWENKTGEHYE